jgi:hypothetical protein
MKNTQPFVDAGFEDAVWDESSRCVKFEHRSIPVYVYSSRSAVSVVGGHVATLWRLHRKKNFNVRVASLLKAVLSWPSRSVLDEVVFERESNVDEIRMVGRHLGFEIKALYYDAEDAYLVSAVSHEGHLITKDMRCNWDVKNDLGWDRLQVYLRSLISQVEEWRLTNPEVV